MAHGFTDTTRKGDTVAKKDDEQTSGSTIADLVSAIKSLPQEDLRGLLTAAGLAPTTIGMTPDLLQSLLGSMGATSAAAMKEAYRQQRKENPNYPEVSVFNPEGKFDDDGNAKPAKEVFKRPTFFNGVRLGGELETPEEIRLFNTFTDTKLARHGRWKLEIEDRGTRNERCLLTIPSRTADDRMENAVPLPLILRELMGGADAVNPETLQRQIEELKAQVAKLAPAGAAA